MTTAFYLSYAALWILVVFQALVLLGLVRRYAMHGPIHHDDDAAENPFPPTHTELVGHPVPSFSATDTSGAVVDESSLSDGRAALLFVSPSCSTCGASLDDIRGLRVKADGRVIVVCRGMADDCAELVSEYDLEDPVVIDSDLALSERFHIVGTPTAVFIENGMIAYYGHPVHGDDLEALMGPKGINA